MKKDQQKQFAVSTLHGMAGALIGFSLIIVGAGVPMLAEGKQSKPQPADSIRKKKPNVARLTYKQNTPDAFDSDSQKNFHCYQYNNG